MIRGWKIIFLLLLLNQMQPCTRPKCDVLINLEPLFDISCTPRSSNVCILFYLLIGNWSALRTGCRYSFQERSFINPAGMRGLLLAAYLLWCIEVKACAWFTSFLSFPFPLLCPPSEAFPSAPKMISVSAALLLTLPPAMQIGVQNMRRCILLDWKICMPCVSLLMDCLL